MESKMARVKSQIQTGSSPWKFSSAQNKIKSTLGKESQIEIEDVELKGRKFDCRNCAGLINSRLFINTVINKPSPSSNLTILVFPSEYEHALVCACIICVCVHALYVYVCIYVFELVRICACGGGYVYVHVRAFV